jgi:Predicted DNA-binding protein with PD1-like DNA-binding motif
MLKMHAFRLNPGSDLKKEIQAYINFHNINAGYIASCAGSLTDYHIRFANQNQGNRRSGHFEIVSLTGTVSTNGSHIHISLSDPTGVTTGGHLLDKNIIYTTAEIIIIETDELIFKRERDAFTGFNELNIERKEKDQ